MKKQSIFIRLGLVFSLLAGFVAAAVAEDDRPRPSISVEGKDDVTQLWVDVVLPDGKSQRRLLRETSAPIHPQATGWDPDGRAGFATWNESGARWFSYSRDAGKNWTEARPLQLDLRLRDVAVTPDRNMPDAPSHLALPPDSRLYIVQFRTISLPEWREALEAAGAEVLAYFPNNAHVVQMRGAGHEVLGSLAGLDMVERIEPYHPWYRLSPQLRDWLANPSDEPAQKRVVVSAFEWGLPGKKRVERAARAVGAEVVKLTPSGHLLELAVDRDQLIRIAAQDDVQWIDPWSAPAETMDLVREDSGANWLEGNYVSADDNLGFCGQGVRGEVMDSGIQEDHPDFDGVLLHGPHEVRSHGTSTYGIVFGTGNGDPRARGHLPCGQGIFADNYPLADRFEHTRQLKEAPYYASFQTNSWVTDEDGLSASYTNVSAELDDIIWRLDIAILHSLGNAGWSGRPSGGPEPLAKNAIGIGGIRHYNTLQTGDDSWAESASFGPADDGRIKPDVSYWYDNIYTTTTESGYWNFSGTSASCPEVAGVLGLMLQMWKENVWGTSFTEEATVFEVQPHFSTLKALLINNAQQYPFSGEDHDLSRYKQGWGRPSVQVAAQRAANSYVVDQETLLELGELATYRIDVAEGESEFKITMVYPDPPGNPASSVARINNLDLRVISPSGDVYHGNVGLTDGNESTPGGGENRVDTVENVFVFDPEAGTWTVAIEAAEINTDACPVGHDSVCGPTPGGTPEADATFSLVVTGGTNGPACNSPDVGFTISPTPERVGDRVQFLSNVSGGAGAPYSYWWDFDGDGMADSTEENPFYVYARPCQCVAKLWVSDAENCPAPASQPVAVTGPDLRYDSFTLAEIEGNGNGGVDAGETWALTVHLRNDGSEPAVGVSAVLDVHPSTPGSVTFLQASATFPDIDVNEVRASDSAFQFRVGEGFPCLEEIVLSLTAIASTDPINTYPDEEAAIVIELGRIPLFPDGFETDNGWIGSGSEAGEWEIEMPQGLGGAFPDPPSAFEGQRVLGNDLTGLGSSPGDYENDVPTSYVWSPLIDISGAFDIELSYQRWLNVSAGDHATLSISSGGSYSKILDLSDIADEGWTLRQHDLSDLVDGQETVQIQFAIRTDGDGTASGWNIDDLVVSHRVCEPFGPYPRYGGVADLTEIAGNGDGVVDGGETWELTVNVRNDGGQPAIGVSADLAVDPATSGTVTMIQSSSTFPDIDPGEVAISDAAYQFEVGNDVPCGGEILLSLTNITTTNPAATYPDEVGVITVPLACPVLRYDSLSDLTETEGNGNGAVDPGETWELTVNLRNDGDGSALGVSAEVVVDPATPATVTLLHASSTYAEIAPGQIVPSVSAYRFEVGDDFPCGGEIVLSVSNISSTVPPTSYADEVAAIKVPVGTSVVIFEDDFQNDKGWHITNSDGQWQRAVPQGLGAPDADPESGFDGPVVLGTDLTGIDPSQGNYENNVFADIGSPLIPIQPGTVATEVVYARWLNVAPGDYGQVYVTVPGDNEFFPRLETQQVSRWTVDALDIRDVTAGKTSLRVWFRLHSDAQGTNSGWNIDGFEVRGRTCEAFEGSLPGEATQLMAAKGPPGELLLSWNVDCGGASSYGVYRGDLAAGYDSIAPEPGLCDIAATSVTVPEGSGNADFFLVVPNKAASEGSYGAASLGPRAPATGACYPQGAVDACAP